MPDTTEKNPPRETVEVAEGPNKTGYDDMAREAHKLPDTREPFPTEPPSIEPIPAPIELPPVDTPDTPKVPEPPTPDTQPE